MRTGHASRPPTHSEYSECRGKILMWVKKGRRGHAAIKLTAGPRRSFDEVEGVENMRATFPELAPSARIDALEKERARQRLNQDIYGARPCRSGPDLKSRWSCPRAA